jgi:hypothetical protein
MEEQDIVPVICVNKKSRPFKFVGATFEFTLEWSLTLIVLSSRKTLMPTLASFTS